MEITRREAALALSAGAAQAAQTSYSIGKHEGRLWFAKPSGKLEFSIGLNHIDPAAIRYPENGRIWRERYGGSMRRWLSEGVGPNLKEWGFNSVGWTQEVVTRGRTNHRHSRPFTADEYNWLDMPFCHLLPFADFHQWEAETRYPDFFSDEFAVWCDHVAREHCVPLANDARLIGYFYVDCPTWVHTRRWSAWKGPLFDPAKLSSESGRKELHRIASQYYRVTFEAVRRYDKNHLILGDRYEAMMPLPEEVVDAASPYVDVLSFQHFGAPEKIATDLALWHQRTGKPVLVADTASNHPAGGRILHDSAHYEKLLSAIRLVPGAVGVHLCGAYVANRVRKRGLLDEWEKPSASLAAIVESNKRAGEWARRKVTA